MELDKICRLCLVTKKDMVNLFTENILTMVNEMSASVKVEKLDGWPEKICKQCLNQVSRCHSFKKKIEKADDELRKYVDSITIIVKSDSTTSQEKQMMQQEQQIQLQIHQQQQQQVRQEQHQQQQHQPIIITNVAQPSLINNGQQLFHSANGQIIGQFNGNAVMIAAPVATQQLLTLPDVNRCELLTDQQFYDEIPIVIQSNNGQQTILNLPHSQIQNLHNQQQLIATPQQHQQQQQVIHATRAPDQHIQQVVTACDESDEAELQEEYEYEEIDETLDNIEESQTYIVENIEEVEESPPTTTTIQEMDIGSESVEEEERRVIEEFLQNQQNSGEPGKYTCSLCSQEFKHLKWLQSQLKSIHINWIKANCNKQPQCSICL